MKRERVYSGDSGGDSGGDSDGGDSGGDSDGGDGGGNGGEHPADGHPRKKRRVDSGADERQPLQEQWLKQYVDVLQYISEHGLFPHWHQAKPSCVRLYNWVSKQRQYQRRRTLDAARVEALEAIPGWRWSGMHTAQWLGHYGDLAALQGRVPLLNNNPSLWYWAKRQRDRYSKETLSAQRVRLLEVLPAWHWAYSSVHRWSVHYAELVARSGLPSHASTRERNAFTRWVEYQRARRRKKLLSPERVALLEAVPGWRWNI